MILFITNTLDPHVDYLISKLKSDFFRFNTDEFIDYHTLEFNLKNGKHSLILNNKSHDSIDLSRVKSVYYRRPEAPKFIENIENEDVRQLINLETQDLLKQLYYCIPDTRWLAPPWKTIHARGRINQLVKASKIGFKTPNTIITSTESQFHTFFKENNNKVIIKTINAGSCVKHGEISEPIFTEIIDRSNVDNFDFDLLKNSPTLFQEYIKPDYELRITSIGSKHLAVKIQSQITDWRKLNAQPEYSVYQLPQYIKSLLTKFLKHYDLNFGCFDLIKKDDAYYFLELNPNGQWLWLELETGIPIAQEINKYLSL